MANQEKQLKQETIRWLNKLEKLNIKPLQPEKQDFLKNIEAYKSDARWFLDKGDFVRAFEAIIWAWAWVEIGEKEGFLEIKEKFK